MQRGGVLSLEMTRQLSATAYYDFFFCHSMHYNEVESGRHIASCKLNHNSTWQFAKERGDRRETGFDKNT